jgi:hypothetical protein
MAQQTACRAKVKAVKGLNYIILGLLLFTDREIPDIFIFFKQVSKGIEAYIGSTCTKAKLYLCNRFGQSSVKALYAGGK